MRDGFTAVIERGDDGFIASCPEIPGANGQGQTIEEARTSLAEAIALILEDRQEDGILGTPADAIQEVDEFEREAALVRQNQELMEFLDRRSRPGKTYTIDEARKLLGIDRPE